MPRYDSDRLDPHVGNDDLMLAEDERVEFPVPKAHRYARYQTMRSVTSPADISQFIELWKYVAKARDAAQLDVHLALAQLIQQKAQVLQLSIKRLTIAKGAVLVLNNPLNEVDVDTAEIEGDLVSNGELLLTCQLLS